MEEYRQRCIRRESRMIGLKCQCNKIIEKRIKVMYNTWSESNAKQQKNVSGLELECFKEKRCEELAMYSPCQHSNRHTQVNEIMLYQWVGCDTLRCIWEIARQEIELDCGSRLLWLVLRRALVRCDRRRRRRLLVVHLSPANHRIADWRGHCTNTVLTMLR